MNLPRAPYGVAPGTHDVQQQGSLGEREGFADGKEGAFADQHVGAVPAIPVKAHVTALGEALVGEALSATPARAAEVHEVDHPWRSRRRMGLRSGRGDRSRRLVARRDG